MNILMRCNGLNGFDAGDCGNCDFAIVELSQEYMALLRTRVELANKLHNESGVADVAFYDGNVRYYAEAQLWPWLEEHAPDAAKAIDVDDFVILKGGAPAGVNPETTACDRLEVRPARGDEATCVVWETTPRDNSFRVATTEVNARELFKMAEVMESPEYRRGFRDGERSATYAGDQDAGDDYATGYLAGESAQTAT
jgi:hypothetical protein